MSGSGDGKGGAQKSNPPQSHQARYEDELEGAVGGVGSGDNCNRYEGMSDDEKRIICQARFLLESYVLDSAQRDHMSPDDSQILQVAVQEEEEEEGDELPQEDRDQLRDVALAFRKIGDEVNEKITKDKRINDLINAASAGSQEEIFMKVCTQMFEDGQLNWGRIFVLFYFAYKVIQKAISTTKDCVGWIKRILKLCLDFFAKYFVWWVLQRGGWRMIMEYWGTSRKTFIALVVASVASGLYYYFK